MGVLLRAEAPNATGEVTVVLAGEVTLTLTPDVLAVLETVSCRLELPYAPLESHARTITWCVPVDMATGAEIVWIAPPA
jgi:hypothetical protein